mmetsp:Transcript_20906/g.32383  ORF Transcript_20906/g.32383 Transcript_20906/m.32383 type:complete len:339 (+) Transcript_20906:3983-4999(+)
MPKLVSITPNAGSLGSSVIMASIQGIGVGMGGFTLKTGDKDICSSAEVVSSGVLKCRTIAGLQIPANSVISFVDESSSYECANSQTSMCEYSQTASAAMPTVSAASITSSTILVLTGTAFLFDRSFTPKVSIGGVPASTVVIDSDTSLSTTWDLGVPVLAEATTPVVEFENSEGIIHEAVVTASLNNPITIVSKSTDLECSFAGGCIIEIEAAGLSAVVKENPESNKVAVCDSECIYSDASDSSSLKCQVPSQSTAYSNQHFGIASETHDLDSGRHFGSGSNASMLFDNEIVEAYSSTTDHCFAGMEFKEGHVGMISQVKYFMGDVDDKLLYAGNLKF